MGSSLIKELSNRDHQLVKNMLLPIHKSSQMQYITTNRAKKMEKATAKTRNLIARIKRREKAHKDHQ